MGSAASLTLATLYWHGPRRLTELAKTQGVSQPSMSGLVSSLERAGMAERRQDPADRRVVVVALSERGTTYVESRRDVAAERFARLIAGLPEKDRGKLIAAVPVLEHLARQD